MGCNCGKKAVSAFIVKVPGQADRRVLSESEANSLVSGIRGARIIPVR